MEILKKLVASKKARAAIAGVIMAVAGPRLGLNETQVQEVLAILGLYILGQGVADHGKEAAKAKMQGNLDDISARADAIVAKLESLGGGK